MELYRKLFAELLASRAAAGGTLSMEEESRHAEALEDAWNKLSEGEQATMELEIERTKVPAAAVDLGLVDTAVQLGTHHPPRKEEPKETS